ncbi:MAG TPA: 3-oxoacyl-[acyl-carrier-protein] reductase [Phycisphaerales bacterium]|nr:3-oxoacyl-[acyl-carrier-protein] reductase [Phycisphaerales bacterium]
MSETDKPLAGQAALVTGAGRGIGKAVACGLAELGAEVLLVARSEDQLKDVLAEIEKSGGKAKIQAADLMSEEQVEAVSKTFSSMENPSILVNNAGITKDTLIMRMKTEQWDDVLNLNLRSAFLLAKSVIKPMMKARYGRIINMTSVIGIRGNAGQSNYAASKAGLIGFTKSLARELGPRNITVNAVAPGYIETEMTDSLPEKVKEGILQQVPLGRMGQPKDIARAVCFLAHPQSDYITGQVLNVDGGML